MKDQEAQLADAAAAGETQAAQEDALAALKQERDRLAAENADLQDRLLRRMAEFENFRRRVEKEKAEIREFAAMEAIRPLLPVLDDLERALQVETADKEYSRGMELIRQRLVAELQKLGLERVPAAGQKFDPNFHHAIEMRQTGEAEDHSVLEELQTGYTFRGRLLRPAMVRVAVAPEKNKEADREQEQRTQE